jgi:hypothetical protein
MGSNPINPSGDYSQVVKATKLGLVIQAKQQT